MASHKKFEEKYSLPYILLSDPEKEVLLAYDVWKEKNMYGKKVMGVVRSSVIIDEEGNIEKVFTKVKAKEKGRRIVINNKGICLVARRLCLR